MIDWKKEYQQGNLRKGAYYCRLDGNEQVMFFDGCAEFRGDMVRVLFYPQGFEVLARVPTYKEFVRKWGVK